MVTDNIEKKILETIDNQIAENNQAIINLNNDNKKAEMLRNYVVELFSDPQNFSKVATSDIFNIIKKELKKTFKQYIFDILNEDCQPLVVSVLREKFKKISGKQITDSAFSAQLSIIVKSSSELIKLTYPEFKQAEYKNWYGLSKWVNNGRFIAGHESTILDLQKMLIENQIQLESKKPPISIGG